MQRLNLRTASLAAVGLVILFSLIPAPLMHWLWWDTFYIHLDIWVLIVLVALGIVIVESRTAENRARLRSEIGFGVLLVISYIFLAHGLAQKNLALEQHATLLSRMPQTSGIRYLPREVAERYGSNRVQDPTVLLGNFQPLQVGNTIDWVAARTPNGIVNSFSGNTQGIAIIRSDGSVELVDSPMTFGEGMAWSRALRWQLLLRKYWIEVATPYYLVTGHHDVLTIVPYLGYHLSFPVMIPHWAGDFIVHSDGNIEDLTPSQAQSDPRFKGFRLFPEEMAQRIASAWGYKNGVLNAWFSHRDQTEIPTIDGSENQMPYLLPTSRGPVWSVAAEPVGNSFGIYKVLLFDAHDGHFSLYQLPAGSSLIGPNKAAQYVRSAFPTYNWQSDSGTGNVITLEPRPIIRSDGILYWQISITTSDYAGVSKTALVNSVTGRVSVVETLNGLMDFIAGRSEHGTMREAGPTSSLKSATVDVTKLSTKELYDLLSKIAAELPKRKGP